MTPLFILTMIILKLPMLGQSLTFYVLKALASMPRNLQINTTVEHLQKVAAKFELELSSEVLEQRELAFVTSEVHGSVSLSGIQEIVRSLVGKVRLGIISNTRSRFLIEETVKHLGLRECFDTFVTSVSAG
jgi:FMN phosphatase YigB (HAD superfamily)